MVLPTSAHQTLEFGPTRRGDYQFGKTGGFEKLGIRTKTLKAIFWENSINFSRENAFSGSKKNALRAKTIQKCQNDSRLIF